MNLRPYPKYKPSGVAWLGDVPEHWKAVPLKSSALVRVSGIDKKTNPGEVPVRFLGTDTVYHRERITNEIELEEFTASPQEARSFSLIRGDVIITKDSVVPTKIAVPSLVEETVQDGVCGYHLASIRPFPTEIASCFLFYALKSSSLGGYFLSEVRGTTIVGIGRDTIGRAMVPLPPLSEQEAIAAFLDQETGRLDRLVGKKRELIERLKEKRTALISRTVTRGLPPAAARAAGLPESPPLKPSGLDWLGEIPEHWQTRRLKRISDTITVGVVVNPSSYVTDEGAPFLLGGDVREFRIDTGNCNHCAPKSSDGPLLKSRLDAGDLVVVRVGYPGVAAVVPPEIAGGNCASMMLVRRHKRFCSQWLAYLFNSQVGRDQVDIVQYGAAQKQFNISHAVDFEYPFPPLTEQTAIAAYLDAETAQLDTLMAKMEEAIERLLEYRIALITAAVTGKINVLAVGPLDNATKRGARAHGLP